MRILFVLEHYFPYVGGAETLFRQTAERLVEEGHQVQVVTTRFGRGLAAREQVNGVAVRRINCRNRFLFTLLAIPFVIRYAGRYDLVHTTPYSAAIPAWLGARLRRKAVVITFHEVWGDLWLRLPYLSRWSARLFRWAERRVLALGFDRYVAVSDSTARDLIAAGCRAERVQRIYNGLDYSKFDGVQRSLPANFTYTYFGRLGVAKGLDLLLPAAARFSEARPDAVFRLIVPRRPLAMFRRIMNRLDRSGMRAHMEVLHDLSDEELYRQVASSSCVVIPSYSEGFCFVAAESVALGVPLVHSGRAALAETVGGKQLEMAELDADALYDCLQRAYAGDYEKKSRPRFPLADSVAAYVELYREIAES